MLLWLCCFHGGVAQESALWTLFSRRRENRRTKCARKNRDEAFGIRDKHFGMTHQTSFTGRQCYYYHTGSTEKRSARLQEFCFVGLRHKTCTEQMEQTCAIEYLE